MIYNIEYCTGDYGRTFAIMETDKSLEEINNIVKEKIKKELNGTYHLHNYREFIKTPSNANVTYDEYLDMQIQEFHDYIIIETLDIIKDEFIILGEYYE